MHALNWFELPALDLERAYRFYSKILNGKVRKGTFGQGELILFDVPFADGQAIGGSLVVRDDLRPTAEGGVVYLNPFGSLSEAVGKVSEAGGQVIVPMMDLGRFGYAAVIIDSEGNKVGLLSPQL